MAALPGVGYDESMSKRRKLLKWGGRVVAGLVVLALLALISADRWRAWRMAGHRERIETASLRVEEEVLKGKTPRDWHLSRVTGKNGWDHTASIDIARRKAREERSGEASIEDTEAATGLLVATESLCSFYHGFWEPDPEILDGRFEQELMEIWLRDSQSFADAYALAAKADCIVILPYDDEYYPQLNGVFVINRIDEVRALLGRVKVLLALGRTEQAWKELEVCVRAQSLQRAPTSLMDALTMHARIAAAIDGVTAVVVDGSLPPARALELLKYRTAGLPNASAAIEAEIVWLYALIHESGFILTPPTWFDWLTGSVPRGKALFANDEFHAGIMPQWVAPINLSREAAKGLEALLRVRDELGRRAVENLAEPPDTDEDTLFWVFSPSTYRSRLLEYELNWLKLELRILEVEQGPLVDNQKRVAEVVARYPNTEHEFDGQDLKVRLAAGLVLHDPSENAEDRLEPLAALRESSQPDDE